MRVKLTTAAERLAIRDTIVGFPMPVCFVDGTKITRFRPTDPKRQDALYDGHHLKHCTGVLVWCNIYGTTIRLDSRRWLPPRSRYLQLVWPQHDADPLLLPW
jgi:hypothetical protein